MTYQSVGPRSSDSSITLYFYGHVSGDEEGIVYARNVQVELKDHATPYTSSSRTAGTIAYDCSGYGNHGTLSGSLENSLDTPRYQHSTVFNNSNYISCPHASDKAENTISAWIKIDAYPTSSAVVFADQSSKISFGFYGNNHAIIACGTEADATRYITNLKTKWDLNKWHNITITKKTYSAGTILYTFYFDGTEWTA
jgi:hypothetical protein